MLGKGVEASAFGVGEDVFVDLLELIFCEPGGAEASVLQMGHEAGELVESMFEVSDDGVPYSDVVVNVTMVTSGGVLEDVKGYVNTFFQVG